jgi:hypothetical protein
MSFVFSTLGFTCVSFCTGALAWWGPKYIEDAIYSMEVPVEERPIAVDRYSLHNLRNRCFLVALN